MSARSHRTTPPAPAAAAKPRAKPGSTSTRRKAQALPTGSFAGPVLVDSGPLLALFNAADHWHEAVLDWLRGHPGARLVSTWPVATEVCALLARRVHNEAALDFLRWAQRGGIQLDSPADGSLTEVLRISERFADLPFDLADASIAEAAARLNIRSILSVDTDFAVYRDRAGRALLNLLA